MRTSADSYLSQVNTGNTVRRGFHRIQRLLAFLVIPVVFWCLKLTGITMAGEAFCGMEEHTHGESCVLQELICELEEVPGHSHTEECLNKELICTLPEQEAHTHTAACGDKIQICHQEETPGHTHSEACAIWQLICTQKETEGHIHEGACFTEKLICSLSEEQLHSHDSSCYIQKPGCGLEESEAHIHDATCMVAELTCQLSETAGHSHGTECYSRSLICPMQEVEGHTHGSECYVRLEGYSCGQEEIPEHFHTESCYQLEEGGYTCGLEESLGHTHGSTCYVTEEGHNCGQEEKEGHSHSETCYRTLESCPIPEHVHEVSCYSDISADLETSEDWEKSMAELIRSSFPSENVVMIARSQLGVTESLRNFKVDEIGVRRGITRYGQWYGNPYGDWSAMFVSFCLDYAGVQDVPFNAGVETMRLEWEEAGLYTPAEDFIPLPGQLLFLDKDEDGEADSVAIVTAQVLGEQNENVLFVVEGDIHEPVTQIGTVKLASEEETPKSIVADAVEAVAAETTGVTVEVFVEAERAEVLFTEKTESTEADITVDMVAETLYSVDDPAILGYGLVPERTPKIMMVSPRAGEKTPLASTIDFSTNMFTTGRSFVIYAKHNGQYYAFISNAASGMETTVAAVPIEIDENGVIYTDVADPNSLLWTFTRDGNSGSNYRIQNVATKRYMHPGGDYGVVYDGNWPTALSADGTGAKLRHTGSDDVAIAFDGVQQIFKNVSKSQATTLYFGMTGPCTVWLDGTQGGISAAGGSQNQSYSVTAPSEFQLPSVWQSPTKYSYTLRGWYDLINDKYYAPGEKVLITGDTVFYADWMASTYDIGQYNAQVSDTVSTNSFITTRLYDYNYLFNVLSADSTVNVSANNHSETWSIVQGENVDYQNRESLDFIFLDYGNGGTLDYPNNRRDGVNQFPGAGKVTLGIYNDSIGNALFATDDHVPGKVYLGTADHLFQLENDPSDPYYGYYYYDSAKNAASYNQSAGRFYIYDYLEATNAELSSSKSDFLPLNSPYANTNGQQLGTYNPPGAQDTSLTDYVYDAKHNDSQNRVSSNYAFGMKMDISFYLPNKPGEGGNKDLYGKDLHFMFSGDDDLWVLVDGKLALDIGGIHQAETGDINFSTGEVTVQGKRNDALSAVVSALEPGEHTLTVMYLERGASHSNCAIYFNLAPRYGMEIRKEDVLTQQLLDGTQFTVYEDLACTKPAVLWESEAAYQQDRADGELDAFQSTFTVKNGVARIWGLGSGNTYYIKETGAPNANGYGLAAGLIRLTLEKDGQTTYKVDVIPDADDNEPSNGFTVHGVRIDEATKTVHIVATNAPESVIETTTVQVLKKWEDNKTHGDDYIQAYLTVTDPDGTVRRVREVTLSDENDWMYIWTNLPKYDYDALTEVKYGIDESYESGYYSTVRRITQIEISKTEWAEATSFINGESYILKHTNGYLSTTSANDGKLNWVDEATAKTSELATWTATVSGGKVKFTNGAGQILSFNYSSSSSSRYFYTTTGSATYQTLTPVDTGNGFRFYATRSNRNYYMASSGINSSGRISSTTTSSSGLILLPMKKITKTEIQNVDNWAYQITNTPLAADNETALSVQKNWVVPPGYDETLYQEFAVTVRLLANGVNTGRSVTLTLKNGWKGDFLGLPYRDAEGNVIQYTVEEVWNRDSWITRYGEITTIGGSPPTYSTLITNTYQLGGPLLPSTGTAARILYVLCGGSIMLTSLVYGIILRRRRERRRRRAFRTR